MTSLRRYSPVLSLAILFGWVLSFPMFGPWLAYTAGANTGLLGLGFLAGHILGLGILGKLDIVLAHRQPLLVGGAMSILTLVSLVIPLPLGLAIVVLFVLGILNSQLVVEWSRWFVRCTEPYLPLALAMISSNILLIFFMLPLAPAILLPPLIAIPVLAAYFLSHVTVTEQSSLVTAEKATVRKSVLALAAFAIVVFFVGGVWFRIYAVPSFPQSVGLAMFDIVCYVLGMAALAWWIKGQQSLAPIAAITLSCLGIGLLLAQSASHGLARVVLSVGLAGADYYFWLALWVLSRYIYPARTFAWGLAFSLIQIALATTFDMYGMLLGYNRQTFFLVALGFTMVLLPVIFNSRFSIDKFPTPQALPSDMTAILTEAESKVFALLVQGASDQTIADELYISRHTVKFHVRNILHKFDAPNRKVLLSRLTTGKLRNSTTHKQGEA